MLMKKKIVAFLIGLAVFCSVVAPQPAQAFSLGEFTSRIISVPQAVASWFGNLFSDFFGRKNIDIADEKSCHQDSDCVEVAV